MGSQKVKSHFAIHEVVALTGFTKHMLDYLARENIFAPSAAGQLPERGRPRRYSYEDVVLLRALHAICAGKGKISHLKDSLAKFRKKMGPITPGQRLEKLLAVQGNKLCVYDGGESTVELVSGQLTLSFIVDLSMVTQAVADSVVLDATSRQVARLKPSVARRAEEIRQRIWTDIKERRERSA
jgi:DNA-binding transcriptional MerR regulator